MSSGDLDNIKVDIQTVVTVEPCLLHFKSVFNTLKTPQNTPLENAAHNTLHENKEKHTTETDERRKEESCTAEYERGRFILFSRLEKGNLRHQMSSKLL